MRPAWLHRARPVVRSGTTEAADRTDGHGSPATTGRGTQIWMDSSLFDCPPFGGVCAPHRHDTIALCKNAVGNSISRQLSGPVGSPRFLAQTPGFPPRLHLLVVRSLSSRRGGFFGPSPIDPSLALARMAEWQRGQLVQALIAFNDAGKHSQAIDDHVYDHLGWS